MAHEAFKAIKAWMDEKGYDWDTGSMSDRVKARIRGKEFSMSEHVESLILSILSANRPWYQVEQNLDKLKVIFKNYDADVLLNTNPQELIDAVTAINCGNRRIVSQMNELSYNIGVLKRIDASYGIDSLCNTALLYPLMVASWLADKDSQYKLKGVGMALALQYLKQLGIDVVKPDVHILRMLQRLGYYGYEPSPEQAFNTVTEIAVDSKIYICQAGEIMWKFCATGYVEMCTAYPRCSECPARDLCQYSIDMKKLTEVK